MRDVLTTLLAIGFMGVAPAATGDGRIQVGDQRSSDVTDPLPFNVSLSLPFLSESVENHVFAVTGSVAAKSSTTLSFVIPETEGLTATLLGEHLRWSFRSPNGRVIAPGETENGADYEYEGGGGISGFHLKRPTKGTWTVLVRSLAPDSVAYAISVELDGYTPLVAHLETIIDSALPNTRNFATSGTVIYVRTFLADRRSPVSGIQWDVQARTHADSSFVIPVFDDGQHADGAAADGIAVGAFRAQVREGGYTLRAACRGPDGAERIVLFFVDVRERSD